MPKLYNCISNNVHFAQEDHKLREKKIQVSVDFLSGNSALPTSRKALWELEAYRQATALLQATSVASLKEACFLYGNGALSCAQQRV